MSFGFLKASHDRSSSNTNQYGTTTPILSQDYTDAFNAYKSSLGTNGVNPYQQAGLGWMTQNMLDKPVQLSAGIINNDLMGYRGDLGGLYDKHTPYTTQAAPQLGAAQSAAADTGASLMGAYRNPFDQDVITASVDDYNAAWDRSLNAMRAGRDAAGAFGDRAAVADAVYNADTTRGLGAMVSGLRQQGFNTAAGFGQADADRAYNASALNANIQNQRDMTNLSAQQQNQQQQLQALDAMQQNLSARTGMSQQVLQNVVTNQGVNMEAAQALLNAGVITQGQLAQLAELAAAGNGSSFTNNTSTRGSNTSISGGIQGNPFG